MTAGPGNSSAQEQYQSAVAAYVAAGGDESVQRVITAVFSLTRKLDQWYTRQLADLGISHGEWSVLAHLATSGKPVTPSKLADVANIAASSMTHRLDRMTERGLLRRSPDPANRTRVLVELTDAGRNVVDAAFAELMSAERQITAALDVADHDQLTRSLRLLLARYGADH